MGLTSYFLSGVTSLASNLASPGALMLQQLGGCCLAAGDALEAKEAFAQSRLILESLGMWKTSQGAVLAKQMAACACSLGDAGEEFELLEEAQSVLKECGRLRSAEGVAVLLDLGSALLDGRQERVEA